MGVINTFNQDEAFLLWYWLAVIDATHKEWSASPAWFLT
jgi:hypothetical protein